MEKFSNRKDLANDIQAVNEKLKLIAETIKTGTEVARMAYIESDVFEYMLHEHITNAHLFGESVTSILPSIYDDLFNGVDVILEQSVGRGAYAFSTLAIDAAYLSGRSNTFAQACGQVPNVAVQLIYSRSLPKQHELRVFEVTNTSLRTEA